MTIPVFTPPRTADQGSEADKTPNVLKTTLGDGYVQRIANGINTILRKQTLNWTNLSTAETKTIDDFFISRKGSLPFYWTPNGEILPLVFVCESWKVIYLSGGFGKISNAMFIEAAPT